MQKYHEFDVNGFIILKNYFSSEKINFIKAAIGRLESSSDVEIFKDRSGILRRMEHFTYRDEVFSKINEEIKNLLFDITNKKFELFKDKINFKPPKGEGYYAHYDGIVKIKDSDGIIKNGWYEYAQEFNNVLIVLDDFTIENGPLEIAPARKGSFETLLLDTKQDGTPNLIDEVINETKFVPILAPRGSVIIFKPNCPHRSAPNYSSRGRDSLYFTYSNSEAGDLYEKYFTDKKASIRPNKAFMGDLAR